MILVANTGNLYSHRMTCAMLSTKFSYGWLERTNLAHLMNIFADKLLIDKFDRTVEIHKPEERLKKGAHISDNHFRDYRLFRPAVFAIWSEFLKEAIGNMLLLRARMKRNMRESRVMWVKLLEVDWNDIERMVDRLIAHPIQ